MSYALYITFWLQQQEKKLEKWLKEAKREEETAAMISEDAEEADFEASMATYYTSAFWF